jgi:stage V sporulation protein AE
MKYLAAFLIGGAICAVGQILMDLTRLTPARILVIFVVAGAVLTAVGVYQYLVDLSGAGATVPLTGFGYSLAKGAMTAAKAEGLLGALTGGIRATAAGIGAAVFFGLLNALIFNPREKK